MIVNASSATLPVSIWISSTPAIHMKANEVLLRHEAYVNGFRDGYLSGVGVVFFVVWMIYLKRRQEKSA
jgi:hypothetical protein